MNIWRRGCRWRRRRCRSWRNLVMPATWGRAGKSLCGRWSGRWRDGRGGGVAARGAARGGAGADVGEEGGGVCGGRGKGRGDERWCEWSGCRRGAGGSVTRPYRMESGDVAACFDGDCRELESAALLRECLRSVARETAGVPHRVIGRWITPRRTRAWRWCGGSFPGSSCLWPRRIWGMRGGNNRALPLVTSEYVALLNPNQVRWNGALERLVAFLDAHPAAGAVGPRLRHPARGRYAIENGGWQPTIGTVFAHYSGLSRLLPGRVRGLHADRGGAAAGGVAVGGVPGGAGCGGAGGGAALIEEWFMYAEDVEWCDRLAARRLGTLVRAGGVGVAPRPAGDGAARGDLLDALGAGVAPALCAPRATRAAARGVIRCDSVRRAAVARGGLWGAGNPATGEAHWHGGAGRGRWCGRPGRLPGWGWGDDTDGIAIDAHMVGTGETGNESCGGWSGGCASWARGATLLYTPEIRRCCRRRCSVAGCGRGGWCRGTICGGSGGRCRARRARTGSIPARHLYPAALAPLSGGGDGPRHLVSHPGDLCGAGSAAAVAGGAALDAARGAGDHGERGGAARNIIRHSGYTPRRWWRFITGWRGAFRPVVDPAALAAVRARYGLPEQVYPGGREFAAAQESAAVNRGICRAAGGAGRRFSAGAGRAAVLGGMRSWGG